MKILAHGHYHAAVKDDEFPPLKELVREATGEHVRRIGRFIQLALIGAGRCVQGHVLSPDTGVYLTSGRGDLEVTLEVMTAMYEHGQPPKPLSFINTVSNSACFYVAKKFALHGRSQFVTRRHAPLESALQLAMLDMESGSVRSALLGSVDICTAPLAEHRLRLGVGANAAVGEGSHWFLLAAGTVPGTALGHVQQVLTLADEKALQDWSAQQAFNSTRTVLAFGQHVPAAGQARLHALTGLPQAFVPPAPPWYDSHAGHTLSRFLDERPAGTLLHADTDPEGRFNVMVVEIPVA